MYAADAGLVVLNRPDRWRGPITHRSGGTGDTRVLLFTTRPLPMLDPQVVAKVTLGLDSTLCGCETPKRLMKPCRSGGVLPYVTPITYRVREPFLGIRNEPSKPFIFVTITAGSIITTKSEIQPGLLDVLYNRQIVAVFMRDIDGSADPISQDEPMGRT
jgi:hypothetical protein